LELVAGKLQGNIAASIITNFKDAQGALNTALNSTGSATKENEAYLNSIQGKLAQFKNSLTGLWTSTISSNLIKGIVDMGTSIVTLLSNITNSVGAVPTTIGALTAAFLLFSNTARTFVAGTGSQMLSWLGVSQVQFTQSSLAVNRFAYSMGL